MRKPLKLFFWILILLASLGTLSFFTLHFLGINPFLKKHLRSSFIIGVVGKFSGNEKNFKQGALLAAEELNRAGGIVLDEGCPGKKVKLIFKNILDEDFLDQRILNAKKAAYDLCKKEKVDAVISSSTSDLALPTSIIYYYNQMPIIYGRATNPSVTNHDFNTIFLLTPNDYYLALQLARFATYETKGKDSARFVILNQSDRYGKGLSYSFNSAVNSLPKESRVSIVEQLSFFDHQKEIKKSYHQSGSMKNFEIKGILDELKALHFNRIFIATHEPPASSLIKALRANGYRQQILGGDALEEPSIWNIADTAAQGLIIVSVFDYQSPSPQAKAFRQSYRKKFNENPEVNAACAYDAVKLISHAFHEAKSYNPFKISETIRNTQNWKGVTGNHSFLKNGNVTDKAVIFKMFWNGTFYTILNSNQIGIHQNEIIKANIEKIRKKIEGEKNDKK